ncbi:MAG: FliH/SctL family protein [Planctomycetota bacterium]|nr:FliH/SctL family protein [Planctomycetota bacterium]
MKYTMIEVIKSPDLAQLGERLAPFEFEAQSWHAGETRRAARRRAARMLWLARGRASRIRDDAACAAQRVQEAQLEQQTETAIGSLVKAAAEMCQQREVWKGDWEAKLLPLAIAIAERLVRRELKSSTDIPLAWIREALKLVSGNGPLRLRMNPDDLRGRRASIEELLTQQGLTETVELVSDDAVSAGGCLVETPSGSIDQRLETQLKRLEEELV